MKWLKRSGAAVLLLPFLCSISFILYEVFGMCINHIATERQTAELRSNLESVIQDIQIISVSSETGNTSGTGNHVDCLSSITFSTQMQESEIKDSMAEYYELNEWSCYITKTEDGLYLFYLNTSAPFADNIEGH